MAENSRIEWTDHTWNPWQGCRPVSPGCDNCYMYRDKKRYGQDPATVKRSSKQTFNSPLKLKSGLVFTCSWSDFFIEEADEWRDEAWEIIGKTPHLTYQILTKRPENIVSRLPKDWGKGWPNVWLGVTAENQLLADKRISILRQTPAAVRFVSVEPMIGQVDLSRWLKETCTNCGGIGRTPNHPHILAKNCQRCGGTGKVYYPRIDWVICGGETGPRARPVHPDWVRDLRDQCQAAGVPFMFKQWGEWYPFYDRDRDDPDWSNIPSETDKVKRLNLEGGHGFHGDRVVYLKRVGKKNAGRLLDGRTWEEFPEVRHG